MLKRYVLTGGPGCGKTSILTGLEMRGELVVREAARDYYLLERARGIVAPTELDSFEAEILRLHLMRERAIPTEGRARVFLDRGVYDHFVYGRLVGKHIPRSLARQARRCATYSIAFLVEPLGGQWSEPVGYTGLRPEELHQAIGEEYAALGIKVIPIAPAPLDNRVEAVLGHVHG